MGLSDGTNLVVGATIGRPHAERIALQTGGETPPLRRLDFAGSGGIWNAPYGKKALSRLLLWEKGDRGAVDEESAGAKLLFPFRYQISHPLFL